MNDTFFQRCETIIGSGNLDVTKDPPILCPSSEEVLCEIFHCIHVEKQTVHILGGNTHPVSMTDTAEIPISTVSLSAIKEVNRDDFLMVSQSGAIVDNVVKEAEKAGLYMPLDITSGDRATIGGAYMTGAVYPGTAGYGAFHKSVLGVRCCTADGDIVTFGGRTTKNVTGYDVTRFLAGTMGLYALAVELILKVTSVPESRVMAVARFLPGSCPSHVVSVLLSKCREIKRFELIAERGLNSEIIIGVSFEGMDVPVHKYANCAQDILDEAGAESVCMEDYQPFMTLRRDAAVRMVGPGFYTISVPPSSSGVFMERIDKVSSEIPVIAHPQIGRFHLICKNADQMEQVRESARAVGGKLPVAWEHIINKAIADLFTGPERTLARSLKRAMDPLGIFNPHIRL